jgi:electron transfer flavoprotein beta subunit
MANMRTVMPALQRAKPAVLAATGLKYLSATPPKQQRQTRIVKDRQVDEIANEIVEWITK